MIREPTRKPVRRAPLACSPRDHHKLRSRLLLSGATTTSARYDPKRDVGPNREEVPLPSVKIRPYPRLVQTSDARVVAVSASPIQGFSKQLRDAITLIAGVGVEGDAHAGPTVQHRSRVAADPRQPNLRQVHLMHAELHDELISSGFDVSPGALGENITTRGVPLLSLPVGTILAIGQAVVVLTGLRNPCRQLNDYASGLMAAVAYTDTDGRLVRKAGVMGVVVAGGKVAADMPVRLTLPPPPHQPLDRV